MATMKEAGLVQGRQGARQEGIRVEVCVRHHRWTNKMIVVVSPNKPKKGEKIEAEIENEVDRKEKGNVTNMNSLMLHAGDVVGPRVIVVSLGRSLGTKGTDCWHIIGTMLYVNIWASDDRQFGIVWVGYRFELVSYRYCMTHLGLRCFFIFLGEGCDGRAPSGYFNFI